MFLVLEHDGTESIYCTDRVPGDDLGPSGYLYRFVFQDGPLCAPGGLERLWAIDHCCEPWTMDNGLLSSRIWAMAHSP